MANWSSPVIAQASDGKGGGRTLVLYGGGDGFLQAFDPVPAGGILKEVWKADCRRKGGEPAGITATPVVHEGRVYAALGDDPDSTGPGNLSCVDVFTGRMLWN